MCRLATAGNLINRNLCERGKLSGTRCDTRVLNSMMPVPAAMVIYRVAPGQAAVVRGNVSSWRTKPSEHKPNLDWAFGPDGNGWGATGAITFKVLRCSAIPPEFAAGTKTVESDAIMPDGSMAYYDAATRAWQSMASLCPLKTWKVGVGCGVPTAEAESYA